MQVGMTPIVLAWLVVTGHVFFYVNKSVKQVRRLTAQYILKVCFFLITLHNHFVINKCSYIVGIGKIFVFKHCFCHLNVHNVKQKNSLFQ